MRNCPGGSTSIDPTAPLRSQCANRRAKPEQSENCLNIRRLLFRSNRPRAEGEPVQMPHFHVISGCSGGGKSSLLAELGQRGHSIVPEPGRRIVAKEQAGDGAALPWSNPAAFARRAIALSLRDLEENRSAESVVFFDRGLIDAACALLHTSPGKNEEDRVLALCAQHRYQPWFS